MQIQDSAERVMRRRSHPRLVRAALERRGYKKASLFSVVDERKGAEVQSKVKAIAASV